LSSTSNTHVPSPLLGAASCGSRAGSLRSASALGRNKVKVVPSPSSLVTRTSPPDCLAKPITWLRPSPVPAPTALVVKKGSKIRSTSSAAMPVPVSLIVTAI
jgi:hypothetical protein